MYRFLGIKKILKVLGQSTHFFILFEPFKPLSTRSGRCDLRIDGFLSLNKSFSNDGIVAPENDSKSRLLREFRFAIGNTRTLEMQTSEL